MPSKPLRPCPCAGCMNYTRESYCPACTIKMEQKRREYGAQQQQVLDPETIRERHKLYNQNRPKTDRFYDTQSWRRLRKRKLAESPLCELCNEQGYVTAAVIVDHIKPIKTNPELKLKKSNLRSLCQSCHNRHGQKVYSNRKKRKKVDVLE